ncbi:MAG: amidohydrolase family protein [Alphaproteobacteria bacterium]
MRGGSQSGAIDALPAIRAGLCDVLASDYYYPALLLAPFRVAAEAGLDFARCWDLVSANPASAVGLRDRGSLAAGKRADILVVDDRDARMPRVAAVVAAGRPAMVDLSVMRSRGWLWAGLTSRGAAARRCTARPRRRARGWRG